MPEPNYAEIGRFIWQNYVPKNGQADTVQGELLRANEKLFDRVEKVIFDWYLRNKEPIPRLKNPDLHR